MTKQDTGQIVIISSPSGGGKTSICRELLSPERLAAGWQFSISYTTRQPREGEVSGREYFFVSDDEFDKLVAQDFFAEHFQVHLYKYGTPRQPLDSVRAAGGMMLLDVDVQGAGRLLAEYPKAISIFVLPPSIEALKSRLEKRGTETSEQLQVRFKNAIEEMKAFRTYGFEYVVVNKELERAVAQVLHIVQAHPCRLDKIAVEQITDLTGYGTQS